MKRSDEILKAALPYIDEPQAYRGFIFGADWADKNPHWNSVEEQLPPSDGNWWVCYSANEGGGEMEILLYDDGGWWDYDGRFITPDVVTHWMPLPQLPKGGAE
jgi:hypothetical protein